MLLLVPPFTNKQTRKYLTPQSKVPNSTIILNRHKQIKTMKSKNITYIQSQRLSMVKEPTTIINDNKITDSNNLTECLRQLISGSNYDLSYQEHFFVLGLSQRNKVTIFAHISTGGTSCTVVDKKVVFSHLILSGSQSFVLCHNHPSSNMTPSSQDIKITNEFKQAGSLLDMKILDHIIISPDSDYFSFADSGIC